MISGSTGTSPSPGMTPFPGAMSGGSRHTEIRLPNIVRKKSGPDTCGPFKVIESLNFGGWPTHSNFNSWYRREKGCRGAADAGNRIA